LQAVTSVKSLKLILSEEKQGKRSKEPTVTVLGPTDMVLPNPAFTQISAEQKSEKRSEVQLLKTLTSYKDDSRNRPGLPKADSLQVVLEQALHSKDKKLLNACFDVLDLGIVKNTIQRLSTPTIVPLAQELIERFRTKPSHGTVLTVWFKTLVLYHSSYLMTIPDLVTVMSSLYLTLDSRLASFPKLLNLSGKLDMILTQISIADNSLPSPNQKTTVYEDVDDEESLTTKEKEGEEEEEGAESSSDEEGEEEEEGEEMDE